MKIQNAVFALWLSASMFQSFSQITGRIEFTFQAQFFSQMQGVTVPPIAFNDPGSTIRNCGNGDWIRFDSIYFLAGEYDSMALYYFTGGSQNASNGIVSLRTDSPTGTVIASVSNLGRQRAVWGEPGKYLMVPLASTSGFHTVYLTFSGADNICDVDKIQLIGRMTSSAGDAKVYYVSTAGDDGNDGLSTDHPFRTIQKAALVMKPGSRCLIRQGIYRETVRPAYTGISAGATLSFEAYNGENAVIDGADPITGWTVHSGSIYKAPMPQSIGKYRNQILVDGNMAWVARSPNVDENYQPHPYQAWCGSGLFNWKKWQNVGEPIAYPTRINIGENGTHGTPPLSTTDLFDFDISQVDPSWTANQIPTTMLNKPTDFLKGGLVTIHSMWWSALGEIAGSSSQSPTKTVFNSTIYDGATDLQGPGWVSHVFALLDAPNEWFRDSASQTLYLWAPDGGDPSRHLVEAKARTLGFDLRGKQYVNVTGLHFLATSLTMGDAIGCSVDKCFFKYISHYDAFQWYETGAFFNPPFEPSTGYSGIFVSGHDNIIKNCVLRGSAGAGVIMDGHNNTVTNCIIHSCDYACTYQAGVSVNKRYNFSPEGYNLTISHNTMHSNARYNVNVKMASSTPQHRVLVEYNDLGPAGYIVKESASFDGQTPGVEVSHNYFHGNGCRDGGDAYMDTDFGASGFIIHHNVFWQGETPQAPQIVGSHWCVDGGDTVAKLFNNTVVDSCTPGARGRDTGLARWWTINTLYARSDTAPWKFTDPAHRDYSLRAGSPAIDKGVVIPGWVESFSGSAPDLGAYEYGQPRWVAGADFQEPAWSLPTGVSAPMPGHEGAAAAGRMPAVLLMRDRMVIRGLQGTGYRAAIYNMHGAMVASVNRPDGGAYSLATHRLAQGMYALKIACGNQTMVRKFTIGPTRE
jgi:hypothetical protein